MRNRNYDALDDDAPKHAGLSVCDDAGLIPYQVHEAMDLVLGFSCFLFFLAAEVDFDGLTLQKMILWRRIVGDRAGHLTITRAGAVSVITNREEIGI